MEYPQEPEYTLAVLNGHAYAWSIYGGDLQLSSAQPPAVLFYCHGFPGSRVEAAFLSNEQLQRHNARFIAIDRPGMGRSPHDPTRRVLDWPASVLAVADYLKVRQFYIMAVSGGAPYALACARDIPRAIGTEGRLRGVAIVSGFYSTQAGYSEMLMPVRIMWHMGAWLPRAVTGYLLDLDLGNAARDADLEVLEKKVDKEMSRRPEIERRPYGDAQVRRTAIDSMREAFRSGNQGVATDLMLVADWGFQIGEIQGTGVRLWHGKQDHNCPLAMAEEAARLMPGSETHFLENEGHLSTGLNHFEDVLVDLLRD